MKKYLYIFFLVFAWNASAQDCFLSLHSTRNVILVGDTFSITLEADAREGCEVNWPSLNNYIKPPFAIIKSGELEKYSEDARVIYQQSLTISCYDSGLHTIAPMAVTTICDSSQQIISDSIPVMVNNVKVDMNADIKEEEETEENSGLSPAQKNILLIFGAILLLTLLYLLYRYFFKKASDTKAKAIDPYEHAISELKKLQVSEETEFGYKNYYSILASCIKSYLQNQIALPVLDKTSIQTKEVLMSNAFTKVHTTNIQDILGRADFAKFAKLPPTIAMANQDKSTAIEIIENIQQQFLQQKAAQKLAEQVNKKKL
jgi:hypothetical protein